MLSMAGRVTLAKSVIQALLSYIMQIVKIPAYIFKEIDEKCRAFVCEEENAMKVHAIAQKDVCKPTQIGGVGLRSSLAMNKSCMKSGWRICTKREFSMGRCSESKV